MSDLQIKQPPADKTVYTWQSIFNIARRHKREIILAHIIALLTTVVTVPVPLLMPLLVDEVLLDKPGLLVNAIDSYFPSTWHGAILYISVIVGVTLVLRLVALVFNVLQTRQFTVISKDVVYCMRRDLVNRLKKVSMAEYESLGSGQINSHLVTDLDTVDTFIGASVSRLLIAVLTIIGTAVILLWMHWQLALFILLLNPFVIYLTTRLGRRVKELKRKENTAYALFQQTLSETLDAIQQIRAYNREQHYLGRVISGAREIREHATAYAWKTDAAGRLSFTVFLFGFDIFRALSMFMVLYSDLSIGEMLAVYSYLWFMMAPMQEILNIQYGYHSAKAALNRINVLFNLHEEPHYPQKHDPFTTHTAAVRLENIHFSYDKQTPVLNDISLTINAGEKVAFVGASGGGKTTLVQVILGLYTPTSGQLYFNETPVTDIGMDKVRDNVATVLQHPALFDDSLRMNLTLGREYDDKLLWNALEVAQLAEFVKTLDMGLDTVLGQKGVRLSGGQRQRVAIARMIIAQPKVVILDEATSALDTQTEHALHTALNDFLADKTTLIIAHRLSAVKQADKVYVFDEGRIIEEGQHENLIEGNGLYAKLYAKQNL